MALINCQYCGHTVSTTADRCPSCGAPVVAEAPEPPMPETVEDMPQSQPSFEEAAGETQEKSRKLRSWILFFILLVLIIWLIRSLRWGWASTFG